MTSNRQAMLDEQRVAAYAHVYAEAYNASRLCTTVNISSSEARAFAKAAVTDFRNMMKEFEYETGSS